MFCIIQTLNKIIFIKRLAGWQGCLVALRTDDTALLLFCNDVQDLPSRTLSQF